MRTGIRLLLATTAVVVVASLSACTATATPLVPDDVVASIQEDGREYTYDVAWQNTRLLVTLIDDGSFEEAEHLALELSARLHRLERARAENMSDRATARTISQLTDLVQSRSREDNLTQLAASANDTLDLFDEGNFRSAKHRTLEVLVIVRWLRDSQ